MSKKTTKAGNRLKKDMTDVISSSGNATGVLLPVEEKNNKPKLINQSEIENKELDLDVSKLWKLSINCNLDEDIDEVETGGAYGPKGFLPVLPTISEEEHEGLMSKSVNIDQGADGASYNNARPDDSQPDDAQPDNAQPGRAQPHGAAFVRRYDDNGSFPLPLDVCIHLEEMCFFAKSVCSKYISEEERFRIQMEYGEDALVLVSKSAASLHLCNRKQVWMEQFYGIPIALIEKQGSLNKIWIYLIERGTGLLLWRHFIDWRSAYTRDCTTFHSMSVPNSSYLMVGLNFDCETGATDFWLKISRFLKLLLPNSCTQSSDNSVISFYEQLTNMTDEELRNYFALGSGQPGTYRV